MEKQVLFRDFQEEQSADFNNLQGYMADSLEHLRKDAVSSGLHYTGLTVSQASATEVKVAAGRFYNNGKCYVLEAEQTIDLISYLPLTASKLVAIVAWGQAVETQVEPRDFLIDVDAGTTEPQAVAMQELRRCEANPLPGAEASDPQPPVIAAGQLGVAYVYLSTTGIDRIEMQSQYTLPNAKDQEDRLLSVETWRSQAEPKISSIATDLSALAEKTKSKADRKQFFELATDVSRVKRQMNLPTTYSSYDADHFGDAEKTDADKTGATAIIRRGLLFPYAGQAVADIALFNPYDTGIKRHADDLILPAYTNHARIQTIGYAGDISLSQYQVQNHVLRKYTRTITEVHYGWHTNFYVFQYLWLSWAAITQEREAYQVTRQETYYKLEDVTTSFNGAIIAQTFLVPNAMWLTQVDLFLTQTGADGDLTLVVCDCDDGGKPNLEAVLSTITVPAADLKSYPDATAISIPPVLLDAGQRYALAVITQGDHRAAIVDGNNHVAGTLFHGTDGDYFTGDLTKDLMFTLYGAQFQQARTEIQLQSVSLAGGIADVHIEVPAVVPDGASLTFEVQVAGKWYPMGDDINHLTGTPDILPVRAVMLGTGDLQPAMVLATDGITGSRPDLAMTHFATERVLAAQTSKVTVQVVAHNFDDAVHTLECALEIDAAFTAPTATLVTDEPDGESKRFEFIFDGLATDRYTVRLTGTRSSGSKPYTITERIDVAD